MSVVSLVQSLSLVEMMIYGFIAGNMLLSGFYLVQIGFQKRAEMKGEL